MGLGIGPLELGVVLLVALLVFGPHRLPELTNALGRTLGEFRRALHQVSAELRVDSPAPLASREGPSTPDAEHPPGAPASEPHQPQP